MTRPAVIRIFSVLFAILLLNVAFMPVVSAESDARLMRSASAGYERTSDPVTPEKAVLSDPPLIDTGNGSSDPEIGNPVVVVGIFIFDYLGESVAVVLLAGGVLAWYNNNNYVIITDAVIQAALNAIIDTLGLKDPKSYKEAYRHGGKWGNEQAVTSAPDPCDKGPAQKSKDYVSKSNGNLVTRYYYNADGVLEITWDYDGHTHGGTAPHAHRWIFENGICKHDTMKRPQVIFNEDGTETLIYR